MLDEEMDDIDIQVNSFAQGRLRLSELLKWFEARDVSSRREILIRSMWFLQNTKATRQEVEEGILHSEQKDTYTAAVLLRRFPIMQAGGKLLELPDGELSKTFKYVASIFKIADTRRRAIECRGECRHPWHHLSK